MLRRSVVSLFCGLLLVLVGAAGASAATEPPLAATGTPTDIGQTQATLVASVNPRGTATTVRFDLGTSAAYGLQSPSKDIGAGTAAVPVTIPVQGLTVNTTYHVRIVATSAAGTVQGADTTFTTARPPAAPAKPSVGGTSTRGTSRTGTTFVASVNPHGSATGYRIEYGTSTSYGAVAGQGDAGSGSTAVPVSAHVEGLRSGTTYHFRVVAASAAGTATGPDRTVKTKAAPTSVTLVGPGPVVYSHAAVLTGRLAGPAVAGVVVHLQGSPYPFQTPFTELATTTSSSSGSYTFTVPGLLQTLRVRVVTDGNPAAASAAVVVKSAARVGILHVRNRRTTVELAGRLSPGASGQGVVSVQRQTAGGRWLRLERMGVAADGRFSVSIARRRTRALTVRVVGLPNDGGAHARGVSRTIIVPKLLRP